MTPATSPAGDTRYRPAPGAGDPGRLLPPGPGGAPESLDSHLARHGALPALGDRAARHALLEEIGRAGLVGRGGAGFPSARKLAAVAAQHRSPAVIANGTEGEPASSKDKVLCARAPHLVLDGAELAAEVLGAPEAFVVVHRAVRDIVDEAVRERLATGPHRVRLRVVTAVDRFVAGEATAVTSWVERGVALPRRSPPRVSERGLLGRPTLVQNVETLAHLALIARHGAEWYRSIGTRAEPGSTLVTLLGSVRRPGVYEIAFGTLVAEILEIGGGPDGPLQAILFGGYSGAWARARDALRLPFSSAGLARCGAGTGAGLVAALGSDRCGLVESARVVRYLAGESAGQCGPCVFGLPALAADVEGLASGSGFDPGRLARTMTQVDGRGACGHPDGVVRFLRSAVKVFDAEIDQHAEGWCCATSSGEAVLPIPVVPSA